MLLPGHKLRPLAASCSMDTMHHACAKLLKALHCTTCELLECHYNKQPGRHRRSLSNSQALLPAAEDTHRKHALLLAPREEPCEIQYTHKQKPPPAFRLGLWCRREYWQQPHLPLNTVKIFQCCSARQQEPGLQPHHVSLPIGLVSTTREYWGSRLKHPQTSNLCTASQLHNQQQTTHDAPPLHGHKTRPMTPPPSMAST